jgi:hypothetical protein
LFLEEDNLNGYRLPLRVSVPKTFTLIFELSFSNLSMAPKETGHFIPFIIRLERYRFNFDVLPAFLRGANNFEAMQY